MEVQKGAAGEGQEDFEVLLSEPHAACQSLQRSVQEIRERLAAMVAQHSRAQEDPLPVGNQNSAEHRSDSDANIAHNDQARKCTFFSR